jgi:hypothetical protein
VGKIAIRSATALLLILALVVGSAATFTPMAAGLPATSMSGTASDGHDGCKGCAPVKMSVADCGTICVSLVAVLQPAAAVSDGVAYPHWRSPDQSVRTEGTEPPTAPPRF